MAHHPVLLTTTKELVSELRHIPPIARRAVKLAASPQRSDHTMQRITLAAIVATLAACATSAPSPEMLKLAEVRTGQIKTLAVHLEGGEFSKRCGYAKPNETIECSQNTLRGKLHDKAYEYCVYYTMGPIQWQGAYGLYPRSTVGTATVTCTGKKTS